MVNQFEKALFLLFPFWNTRWAFISEGSLNAVENAIELANLQSGLHAIEWMRKTHFDYS